MEIIRRRFLGSVLGLFASSQIPLYWKVEPIANETINDESIANEKFLKLLLQSKSDIIRSISGITHLEIPGEETIFNEQPKINDIILSKNNDKDHYIISFKMENINCVRCFTSKGLGLIWKSDKTICRPVSPTYVAYCDSGDQLKYTYHVRIDNGPIDKIIRRHL